WLASAGMPEHRPRTVITLAVGEVATLVGGFQLEWSLRGLPAVRAASVPKSVAEAGYRSWNRRLLELLRERLKEAPPEGYTNLLHRAALRGSSVASSKRGIRAVAGGPRRAAVRAPLPFLRPVCRMAGMRFARQC